MPSRNNFMSYMAKIRQPIFHVNMLDQTPKRNLQVEMKEDLRRLYEAIDWKVPKVSGIIS